MIKEGKGRTTPLIKAGLIPTTTLGKLGRSNSPGPIGSGGKGEIFCQGKRRKETNEPGWSKGAVRLHGVSGGPPQPNFVSGKGGTLREGVGGPKDDASEGELVSSREARKAVSANPLALERKRKSYRKNKKDLHTNAIKEISSPRSLPSKKRRGYSQRQLLFFQPKISGERRGEREVFFC